MDLNIMLWTGGTLFSLGIFAVKVGAGLGYGRTGRNGVLLTIALYLALFELIALLADRLLRILEPLLRGGPWLHGSMALGMILWGLYIIMRPGAASAPGSPLALLVPCPVCLTAMTFSTWTALNSLPLRAWAAGLLLGGIFSVMTLLVMAAVRPGSPCRSVPSLGLAMVTIGLYFIASLFLPARIEQAKGVYGSFLRELQPAAGNGTGGMMLPVLLLAALLIGFFSRKGGNR
jgi:predicted transporter